jgi:hypothetical protein
MLTQLYNAIHGKLKPHTIEMITLPRVSPPSTLMNAIPMVYRQDMENKHHRRRTVEYDINIHSILVKVVITTFHRDEDIESFIPWIVRWFSFVLSLPRSRECSTDVIEVFIFLLDHKKELPSRRHQPITQVHVNTAVTHSCPHYSDNTILIYRREEWLRGLIHETIHFFGLDFSGFSQKNRANILLLKQWKGLSPNMDLYIFESYCDAWAVLLHTVILSTHSNLKQNVEQERKHAVFQCAKVLEYTGLTWEMLREPGAAYHYRESTPILSYYVLKSIVLFNMESFFKLFDGITFPQHYSAIEKYVRFIHHHSLRPKYLETVEKMRQRLSSTPYGKTMTMAFLPSPNQR